MDSGRRLGHRQLAMIVKQTIGRRRKVLPKARDKSRGRRIRRSGPETSSSCRCPGPASRPWPLWRVGQWVSLNAISLAGADGLVLCLQLQQVALATVWTSLSPCPLNQRESNVTYRWVQGKRGGAISKVQVENIGKEESRK